MAVLKSLKLGFFRCGQSNISASLLYSWYLSFQGHWVLTALRKIKEVLIWLCKTWHFSLSLNFRGCFYEETPATPSQCPGTFFCHMQSVSISFMGMLGDWINWKCSLFSDENKSCYSCKKTSIHFSLCQVGFSVCRHTEKNILKKPM